MGLKYLFSPVGGTDPISVNNCCDGSILQICRYYKPDVVYLYLSAEMVEFENKDQRYSRALGLLGEHLGHKFEIIKIEKPELKDVHKYDFFYGEFKEELSKILSKLGQDDRLYLNVSSGTPAMKNALGVLTILGELNCTCIQVATPEKKKNDHGEDKVYPLDTLWEMDPDNDANAVSRCEELVSQNLTYLRDRQNIERFTREYHYVSAFELASTLPAWQTEKFIGYLECARERELLNLNKVLKLETKLKCSFLPFHDSFKNVFEYALVCDLKRRRGEYADFIRSLSPLILELFELIINCKLNIKLTDLTSEDKKKMPPVRRWDQEKIYAAIDMGSETVQKIRDILLDSYKDYFRFDNPVGSDHLCMIIEQLIGGDIAADAKKLREQVERTIRNSSAHQIMMVDDQSIKKLTGGLSSDDVMQLIRRLFAFTELKIGMNDERWNSYDSMNRQILANLS